MPLSKMHDVVATPRDVVGNKLSPNGKWLPYCMQWCALKALDTPDIVRDGDFRQVGSGSKALCILASVM
jgi:hypothetical protein